MVSNAHASDAKKGEALAQGLCAACHASDGNSVIPSNPILAGQHYSYLKNQLNYFQVKEGEDRAKRENAVMLGIASGLSSDDIDNLSAYYSQQKIKPSYASNVELAKAGEVVYELEMTVEGYHPAHHAMVHEVWGYQDNSLGLVGSMPHTRPAH